ncbi:MAG: hypothetical protein M3R18_06520 [Pseudomonadota bacterium]|nr:hypothetical protein [Pseudomonadota bacterium]
MRASRFQRHRLAGEQGFQRRFGGAAGDVILVAWASEQGDLQAGEPHLAAIVEQKAAAIEHRDHDAGAERLEAARGFSRLRGVPDQRAGDQREGAEQRKRRPAGHGAQHKGSDTPPHSHPHECWFLNPPYTAE